MCLWGPYWPKWCSSTNTSHHSPFEKVNFTFYTGKLVVYPGVHWKKQSINKDLLAHPWVLQSFTTSAILSQYPPYFSSTTLVLVLTIFPPPQDLSHFENPVHGPHAQGTKNSNTCKWKMQASKLNMNIISWIFLRNAKGC